MPGDAPALTHTSASRRGAATVAAGAALLLAMCGAAAFWPLRNAGFTGDDWHFLALLRHIDSPLAVFDSNIALSYLYRPVALLVFWASVQLFELAAIWHYLLNVALHAFVAAMIAAIARLHRHHWGVALLAAGLFLVLPATASTAFWISNRFDLLATGAMLLALYCTLRWASVDRGGHWAAAGAASLMIAMLSKESAYAAAPALVLIAVFASPARPLAQRLSLACAFALCAAVAVLLRAWALDGLQGDRSADTSVAAIVNGVRLWFRGSWHALTTGGVLAPSLAAAAGIAWTIGAIAARDKADAATNAAARTKTMVVLALIALVLTLLLLQGPIMAVALRDAATHLVTVSLRFYYSVIAVVFVLALISLPPVLARGPRIVVAIAALVALPVLALATSEQARSWARDTRQEAAHVAPALQLVAARIAALGDAAPCVVDLRADPAPATAADLDLRLKAALRAGDPRVRCITISEPPQLMTLTRHAPCDGSVAAPWRSKVPGLQPAARSGTCTYIAISGPSRSP